MGDKKRGEEDAEKIRVGLEKRTTELCHIGRRLQEDKKAGRQEGSRWYNHATAKRY